MAQRETYAVNNTSCRRSACSAGLWPSTASCSIVVLVWRAACSRAGKPARPLIPTYFLSQKKESVRYFRSSSDSRFLGLQVCRLRRFKTCQWSITRPAWIVPCPFALTRGAPRARIDNTHVSWVGIQHKRPNWICMRYSGAEVYTWSDACLVYLTVTCADAPTYSRNDKRKCDSLVS